jgi:glycosyltransferase involved in cell wall biosynthesis
LGKTQIKVFVCSSNARSLIANRGNLIHELTSKGIQVSAAVPVRDWLPEVADLGIEIHPVNMGRSGLNPVSDLVYLLQLVWLMRKVRPQKVFAYGAKPVIYGALAAKLASVSGVYSMITGLGHVFTTNTAKTRLVRWLMSQLYRFGIGASTCVFFQNADDLQEFLTRGIVRNTRKVVLVNGSGIDLTRFEVAPLPAGTVTFLFIGRLLTEKGISEFVQAANLLKAKGVHARFVAVGPHDPVLPHAVSAADLQLWKTQGVVEFVGGVKDVRPYIEKCSVLVLPSYREGTPRAVLEAMSMGRPIITTNAPGCRETVVHGENGFLVPPQTVEPLAQAMQRFVLQPELLEPMGNASRKIAQEKYDVRKVNAVILKAMGLAA